MEAEAEAVTMGDRNMGGSSSGVDEDNGNDSDGRCTDKNNQQSTKSSSGHGIKNDYGDSNDNNDDNDGNGGGGDGGRWWRWAL